MGVIGWLVSRQPVWELGGHSVLKTELLAGGMTASVLFYIIVMRLLKSEELAFVWEMVRRRKNRWGEGATGRGGEGD
jgi:hypothetical protein